MFPIVELQSSRWKDVQNFSPLQREKMCWNQLPFPNSEVHFENGCSQSFTPQKCPMKTKQESTLLLVPLRTCNWNNILGTHRLNIDCFNLSQNFRAPSKETPPLQLPATTRQAGLHTPIGRGKPPEFPTAFLKLSGASNLNAQCYIHCTWLLLRIKENFDNRERGGQNTAVHARFWN